MLWSSDEVLLFHSCGLAQSAACCIIVGVIMLHMLLKVVLVSCLFGMVGHVDLPLTCYIPECLINLHIWLVIWCFKIIWGCHVPHPYQRHTILSLRGPPCASSLSTSYFVRSELPRGGSGGQNVTRSESVNQTSSLWGHPQNPGIQAPGSGRIRAPGFLDFEAVPKLRNFDWQNRFISSFGARIAFGLVWASQNATLIGMRHMELSGAQNNTTLIGMRHIGHHLVVNNSVILKCDVGIRSVDDVIDKISPKPNSFD